MESKEKAMKINAVKDKSGKVIATFQDGSGSDAQVKPILAGGQKVEQLEVAVSYQGNPEKIYS
jgi:hypothetical protein